MAKVSLQEKLEFIEQIALRHRSWECLIWPFPYTRRGSSSRYPQLDSNGGYKGVRKRPHTYICSIVHGPRTTLRYQAAHTCGVYSCVNPLHIRWKSPTENAADRLAHDTHAHGERAWSAKLTNAQAAEIRASNESPFVLAARYGVSPGSVRFVQRGLTFKAEFCS